MIARILPVWVACSHVRGDAATPLYPEEEAAIRVAVDRRRREFTTVRHCARQALAALGHPAVPLVPQADRSPRWPDGIVGSMTHCDEYRAAAVALASDAVAIGIDAEPNEPLPEGLLPSVAVPAERTHLAWLARVRPDVCWDRLTFSAKESLYKVWSPLTGQWLGFEQASVTFDLSAQTFAATLHRAELMVDGQPRCTFTGRWTVSDGMLATSIVIARADRSHEP